jgi:F-type H+-transporting ATPase subunit gamma
MHCIAALSHLKVDEGTFASTSTTETAPRRTVLVCSSDRGLCGAIHSSVAKVARQLAREKPNQTSIVVLGDKAKPQVARDARKNIALSFNQVGKAIPTFLDALVILQNVQAAKLDYANMGLIYNRFISVIAYEPTLITLPSLVHLKEAPKLGVYELEDEILENYVQFIAASRLFWALVEGHAAEMAAKRTAMENATKNAEEIVGSLTMKYNRTRQSVITNELVDIIVGASAL